ncbi:hypothetical protein KKG29_02940 [Patescibacteria group bacterium]|nr:hypothetical protein [Patescibacteria group bacterium]MBU4057017.1 hypothetical protein [Patescibacteria group bacterium]MBU4103436.1 hypothetical protein [Patescibacteria group bacterium]MBU4368402.1 hypothetical protein [Patescibacteria group bacterium]
MKNFKKIKEKFNQLSQQEKDNFLQDIYNFSKDTKLFLENRLLGGNDDVFIKAIEKETIGKVYKKGLPGTPNGVKVNSIIVKAKKSGVSIDALMKLERLAYRGFIEFLNEFGGGPESFDEMADKHMENYLILVRDNIKSEKERNDIFQDMKKYLLKKNNMYTDSLDDVFKEITGISVDR